MRKRNFHIGARNFRRRRNCFTLIELLIIISIIAILTSILLPALNTARTKAQSAICLNGMKQSALCCTQYYDLYGYFMPFMYHDGIAYRYWIELLNKSGICETKGAYELSSAANVAKLKVFVCPAVESTKDRAFDIALNGASKTAISATNTGRKNIKSPSRIIQGGDTGCGSNKRDSYMIQKKFASKVLEMPDEIRFAAFRHNEKGNFFFFDGHAESCSRKSVPRYPDNVDATNYPWSEKP